MTTATYPANSVVSPKEWKEARQQLLLKEKEATRLRDEISRQRRELPWVTVEKTYKFQTGRGVETLADLFEGRHQLIIYHFMLGPGWEEGCKSCSYLADHFDATMVHLAHRDTSFVVVSRAPLNEIQAFQKRMGWNFKWVSSYGSDFNYDFGVSFTSAQVPQGGVQEGPGASVFYKAEDQVFHTYSTYARGLDILVGTYNLLDLTPKGRDEDDLTFTMSWLRHHDKYGDDYRLDPTQGYIPPKINNACCHSTEPVE